MSRLLFVEDHPLYRTGVRVTLERAMPELEVVLAGDSLEALALLDSALDIDLCLTDLRLPDEDGFSLLEQVRRRWPSIARGVLCADPTADTGRRARALGCIACLSKARDMDGLADALSALFNGDEVFDVDSEDGPGLSGRRRFILELAAKGQSNKQIARELGITERTVKDHWSSIFGQLAAANRAEAISRAHQLRLI